jgi:hypothetical protein
MNRASDGVLVADATDARRKATPAGARSVHPDALLCALVLAPNTFARNRFFGLYEDPALRRVRRRAYHVRGVLRQLLGQGKDRALLIGRAELGDARVLLRYRIESVKLERTTALSALESSVLNYALHRAGQGELEDEDRARVENALRTLGVDAAVAT